MNNYPQKYPEVYSSEDIQKILAIAFAQQDEDDILTRSQLWEIAEELNIDKQIIETAESKWLEIKNRDIKREAFNVFRRRNFRQKLTKFLIVNTFLVSFNFLLVGVVSWSLYIILFWGLGLTFNGWKAYQTEGEAYEKAYSRWKFNNEVKETVNNLWQRVYRSLGV